MNLFEFLSTKKFNLSGNIDERYFQKNDDGTYKATPLFIYNVARDVAADIKTIILGTDDPNYVTHSNNKGAGYEQKDSWAEHEHNAAWKVKYKTQIEAADKKWKEYKEAHPNEFKQNAPTIAVGDETIARFFSAYHPDFSGMSNSELMSMYVEAVALGKRFGNNDDLRGTLPQRPGNLLSKDEFKATHAAIRKKIAEDVGLPEDDYVVPTIHKDDRASLIKANSKAYKAIQPADGSMFEEYVNGLTTHLTSSTPDAYQKEWEELYTDIESVCDTLTRGGRGTKLSIQKSTAKNALNIAIFTADKDDGSDRIKLAGINKIEPTDTFYTFTLYITSGGKRPIRHIATKAELRKTLEDLIDVLEENDLNEYIDCVNNAISNLL